MRKILLIFFIALFIARPAHSELPLLEPLTPQNLYRLEQIGLIQRGTVEELAWSPDEAKVAVAGSAGLRVYTIDGGREQLLGLLGHLGGVNDVDFSPDGREVASAGDDGTLRLWDPVSGLLLRALDPYADLADCGCIHHLTSAKFSADGDRLWVGADNGPLRVIDAGTGAILAEDPRHVLEIIPDFSRSRFAITEQHSSRVTVWPSSGTFSPVRDLDMRFTVWNASFVPGTQRLLVAGFVGSDLTLVDSVTSETVDMLRGARVLNVGSAGSVVTQVIDWQGDVRHISLRVTNIDSGEVQFNSPLSVELTDARFSPSGRQLAVSDSSGALTVWDWRRNLRLLDLPPKGTALIGMALLDNGLVASIDGGIGVVQTLTEISVNTGDTVRLWDIASGREVGVFHMFDYGLSGADMLYWDNDINRLIIGSTEQPQTQLELNTSSGAVRVVERYDVQLLAEDQYGADHPGGLIFAVATDNNDVRVAEAADQRNMVLLHDAGPGVRFTTDGKVLLAAGASGAITLWGVRSTVPAPD